jgi:hypothetical protein
MSDDEKRCLTLGQMVAWMIHDVRKQAGTDVGYAWRRITFPGGDVYLIVANDVRLADLFDSAVAKAYEIADGTPASEIN